MSNDSPVVRGPDGSRLDRLFDAFSESRRRRAVRILAASSAPIAFDELAAAVVADEADEAGDVSGAGASVNDVALSFHHRDLPKLAEFGLVSYGGPEGRVEYTATDRLHEAVAALLDVDARFG